MKMKMSSLLMFTFSCVLMFTLSSSCSQTPSLWCSSREVAVTCRVLKRCLDANLTRSQQTAEVVKLEVYYESLCPDCIFYITQVLYPTWLLLQDIFSVSLLPFGNAQEKPDGSKFMFKCQHGEQECLGNTIQACLLNMSDNAFLIIFCMEASTDVIAAAKSCVGLYSPQLSWERLMSCVNGDEGNQLMHQNALKTQALVPPHRFVPWVTVNGEHTDDLQRKATTSLFTLVCSMYKGVKPVVCGGDSQKHSKIYVHN
ncbi:gamma-interferon-inducible lysosomal thiol reductase [Nerophis lumbriciformis]|uniref:gamma-interferon-inducible lysosomal thiol reductase n=1 Tax=Nerophis lumbriciformis TaxID=546530 RepID=UPI002ADF2147|nr:gamma-interferon-inducible lysosomal thiol reductase-like [Nerophis lumbriciformis]